MPEDINQAAARIVRLTSRQPTPEQAKNAAAVALGRLGGLKGGKARAASMTKAERSKAARKAVAARWAKQKKK